MNREEIETMSNMTLLKKYFGSEGYPAVNSPELMTLKKNVVAQGNDDAWAAFVGEVRTAALADHARGRFN